jgi:hypothetical protein
MPVKLVCRKAHEKSSIESDISELEQEGYDFQTVIPISSDPKFADMCIILTKHR